jgi:hypothetical protein
MSQATKMDNAITYVKSIIPHVPGKTLEWLSIVVLNFALVPSLLAMMSGLTDKLPPIDYILLVWVGLALMFLRAAINKDILIIVTIGLGFLAQAAMLALIFVK